MTGPNAADLERDPPLRKMTLGDIRWYGAWGSVISVCTFLRMCADHDGWRLAFDFLCVALWTVMTIRFLRLRIIVIECETVVIKKASQ